MLFYTSLFIASLFAALVIHWAYHAIASAGHAVLKTMLPDTKKGPTGHLGTHTRQPTINGTPTPWGWKSHDTPTNLAKTHAAKPVAKWGDSQIAASARRSELTDVGWVQREERSELGGKAYKVTRKVSATAAGFKTTDRPWGW